MKLIARGFCRTTMSGEPLGEETGMCLWSASRKDQGERRAVQGLQHGA